jgi:quercetin dioxygenase-like cupin family protein
MPGGHSIMHRSDFERTGNWSLARRSLDLGSFGMNVVEIAPGESIPEHDETERDQEEVFVVLEGSPTMVIDGNDHPAPAGTFVRLDPEVTRTMRNDGDEPAHVLIVSAPTTSGYRPLDWA